MHQDWSPYHGRTDGSRMPQMGIKRVNEMGFTGAILVRSVSFYSVPGDCHSNTDVTLVISTRLESIKKNSSFARIAVSTPRNESGIRYRPTWTWSYTQLNYKISHVCDLGHRREGLWSRFALPIMIMIQDTWYKNKTRWLGRGGRAKERHGQESSRYYCDHNKLVICLSTSGAKQ